MAHCGIDIGHARGTGAASACGRHDEHELNAKLAGLLAGKLRARGQRVTAYDYPAETNRRDLERTIRAANADGVDLLVSLHSDASANPAAHGAHVCYASAEGAKLARCIARRLSALLPGRAESVVRRRGLAILNRTRCVAVLGENGFVTNAGDMAAMAARMDEAAEAYAQGIADYLQERQEP